MTTREKLIIGGAASVSVTLAVILWFFIHYLPNRKTKGMKTTSWKGKNLIKNFEGFRENAYYCSSGIPTIGYGHTTGVVMGDTCTKEQAEMWLDSDLKTAEATVNNESLKISQNQFDALVSFVFNVGSGMFKTSTLLKKIKADPDDKTIADEFAKWKLSGGVVVAGLVTRRTAESELYFG